MSQHYCYILYNDTTNDTYVGYTNNPERRLRQHNGEIKGGATFTTSRARKKNIQWKFLCIITFNHEAFTKNMALSFEWHLKFEARKHKMYRGPNNRMASIAKVLENKKFSMLAPYINIITNEQINDHLETNVHDKHVGEISAQVCEEKTE